MGFFDKILNVMKLNGEDEYDDEYDDDEYAEEPAAFVNKKKNDDILSETSSSSPVEKRTFTSSKITPLRSKKTGGSEPMEVCVFKPSSFEDAREIGETLLAKQTVILNMEGVDVALAQRIVDFASGACFALEGNLQKVSNFIFVITPAQVSISGDLQEIVNNFDFNGIKTGF
jgi:cell division inhibitor SepF